MDILCLNCDHGFIYVYKCPDIKLYTLNKYIQFIVHQFYLNKAVKVKRGPPK